MLRSNRTVADAAHTALETYFLSHVDNGSDLCCPRQHSGPWGAGCAERVPQDRVFAAGQLSYVGDYYALADARGVLRIMFLGMQTGEDRMHKTMAFRAVQVRGAAEQGRATSTRHMDATAAALGVLLGTEPAEQTVVVDGVRRHVFECFALANAALCSSAKPGAGVDPRVGRGGSPAAVFYKNCRPHLAATIALIRPTIVVVQGRTQGGWSPSRALLDVARCDPVDGDDQLVVARLASSAGFGAHRFVAALFPHPGVQDERSWQSGWNSRYFNSDVAPRLRTARELAA